MNQPMNTHSQRRRRRNNPRSVLPASVVEKEEGNSVVMARLYPLLDGKYTTQLEVE